MYTLMNKNKPLADFEWLTDGTSGPHRPILRRSYELPWFITDFEWWIQNRVIPGSRCNTFQLISEVIKEKNVQGVLRMTRGISLEDTLWINEDDKLSWEQVNPFTHEFNRLAELVAFNGYMDAVAPIDNNLTPEFGTDGAMAKCWHRETDGRIYMYKQGTTNYPITATEAYTEMYASQLIKALGFNDTAYDVIHYQDQTASRCELFTSEREMLVPSYALCKDIHGTYQDVKRECCLRGLQDQLAEYVIADALTLNRDRHLGNIGIICNADTFELRRLAPIYDNGTGLLYRYRERADGCSQENQPNMMEIAEKQTPHSYHDYITEAKELASAAQLQQVQKLRGFKFDRSGEFNLRDRRLDALEEIVQLQVEKLLSE